MENRCYEENNRGLFRLRVAQTITFGFFSWSCLGNKSHGRCVLIYRGLGMFITFSTESPRSLNQSSNCPLTMITEPLPREEIWRMISAISLRNLQSIIESNRESTYSSMGLRFSIIVRAPSKSKSCPMHHAISCAQWLPEIHLHQEAPFERNELETPWSNPDYLNRWLIQSSKLLATKFLTA